VREDDFWLKWLRRRTLLPFSRRWVFEDFDDIFLEMQNLLESESSELSAKAPKELVRERTLPSGDTVRQWGPFVYGYSMTVGPDGKSHMREFGNIKPETWMGKPHLDIKEKREPLVDIVINDGEIKVIVELPGVEKKEIKLKGTENDLLVSVDTPKRKFYKKLEMPVKVDPKTAKSSYKNGVLEVTIQKKKEEEPKGEQIKID
jgi:HSP20 family protein